MIQFSAWPLLQSLQHHIASVSRSQQQDHSTLLSKLTVRIHVCFNDRHYARGCLAAAHDRESHWDPSTWLIMTVGAGKQHPTPANTGAQSSSRDLPQQICHPASGAAWQRPTSRSARPALRACSAGRSPGSVDAHSLTVAPLTALHRSKALPTSAASRGNSTAWMLNLIAAGRWQRSSL